MALVVFGSQKGAPGASLAALTAAAAWPERDDRRVVFLEADPDGGVVAVRYGLGREPGLLSLAAAGRHGIHRGDLWAHTQQLPGGLAVVAAPDRPDQATNALNTAGDSLGVWLAGLPDVTVVADVGRFSPSSPAMGLIGAADLLLMVARPVAEQIQPGAERLKALPVAHAGWCLIGDKPYAPVEIEAVHQIPVLGVIADDPRGAAALETDGNPGRVKRSPMVRTAAALSSSIDSWLYPEPVGSEEPPADLVKTAEEQQQDAGASAGWDQVEDAAGPDDIRLWVTEEVGNVGEEGPS